ncbi:hypothetical protein [Nostoc sp. DSM 114159]
MNLNADCDKENNHINYLYSINVQNSWSLIKSLINLKIEDKISVFFFLIQSDYLVLAFVLKVISRIFNQQLKIYYLMHEPKFEKARINPLKAYIIFIYHLLFGYIADKILVPSNEALLKAKTFINYDKLYKLNLSFVSPDVNILQSNLKQLKLSWDNAKTFSLLGRSDIDKNPQGFLNLVNIINKHYPEKVRFIRGGRDRNVQVLYDEEVIIRFNGFISNSAKKFLLGLTHFVVIPYSYSTQSGVVAEALSYGKLLIVNDIPTFSYLQGLKFVYLIDFNDQNAMLKCIHNLFTMDVNEYENRYWEAIRYFQENHSDTYISKVLRDLLEMH